MGRTHLAARFLIGLVVVFGMLAVVAANPVSANHGARITIHKAVCDSGVNDIYGKCHDNRLGGVPFRVAGVWRNTNGSGVVSWTPGAGTKTITEDWNVFDDYDGAYVYCSNQVTGAVLWNGLANSNGTVTIHTTAGQEVICDWYNLT